MSRQKVLVFIISVFAILTAVSAAFPKDGLAIAGVQLNFPTLSELAESLRFTADSSAAQSPEELLQQRMSAVRAAEQDRFETYFTEDPARIHFPDGDITLFDPFFRSLDNAGKEKVRILHYGDSQIEEDRITSTLRNGLQGKFGGGGPGLLPFGRPYYTLCASESSTASLRRYIVFGEGSKRSDGKYGVMGQCARMDTSVYTSVSSVKSNIGPSRSFSKMTLLAGNISGKVRVKCNGRQFEMEPADSPSGVRRLEIDLPDSSTTVRFSAWGSADIYGMQLDDSLGVSVDNIPMRGCSGTVFTRINSAQLKEYVSTDNVRLILLQFGGNSMPFRKTPKAISEYKTSIEKQIRHLKAIAPRAAILFIGPSDMSVNIKGRMTTYPHLPMMVDSLKAAANNAGAAYWDLYSAMGGNGSMAKWVKARPALAGSDYVHFTPRGAEATGNMLLESLLLYYDYYKWRRKGGA